MLGADSPAPSMPSFTDLRDRLLQRSGRFNLLVSNPGWDGAGAEPPRLNRLHLEVGPDGQVRLGDEAPTPEEVTALVAEVLHEACGGPLTDGAGAAVRIYIEPAAETSHAALVDVLQAVRFGYLRLYDAAARARYGVAFSALTDPEPLEAVTALAPWHKQVHLVGLD